ncbi:Protein of unknown function DUF761, plant protein [Actinidia chinensis var. chinensis]|uniref:Uncharacterized protein n=1 Tax=Actinidia chinensis var. chinensis TaxID=1590841 RepID=A0A2R6RT15_ACTCC|nr:Protein of unknown function DUF761, plant protein [Actinidia chinensis var. chinensis]
MLNSTIELISLAASNSHFIFGFCNLIIVILLVGGSKPTSEFPQDSPVHHPKVVRRNKNDVQGTNTSIEAMVVEEKGNNEEDDDELRRRVEEFIDKINKGWKAEKLRTSVLV